MRVATPSLAEPLPRPLSERRRKPLWREQYVLVVAGAALGALAGALFPAVAVDFKPLGDAFISLIKMTIAPLIFLVVVTGIAQVGDMKAVGRIGIKAFVYFEIVTTLCLMFSFFVVRSVQPGVGVARATPQQAEAVARYSQTHMESLSAYLQHMIPDSFVGAFARGEVLQVLVLALLCGIGLLLLGERGQPLRSGMERITELVFSVVHVVVTLAPIGAFGAMAFTVAKFGVATLYALALLVGTAWAMMAFFIFVVLGAICRMVGIRLLDLLRMLRTELLVVLGTSSSETAIPGMMEKLPAAGVGRAVAGLVIPSGYSFNLDGVALTLPLSTMFVAQVYGIELTSTQQLGIFAIMLFTSKGAAGVTGGAFAALAATVLAAGLPAEGLALLLGIDRFMSLARAITNTVGNAVAAIVVAKWDGEFDRGTWSAKMSQLEIAK
ncbi:C4-dicarboxylate transport protein [Bradyrhizobium sp. SSBR45G]|uniref:cation:dicarboxylate symporter family transporter n=1 Tax=unclassified Bradyrhizobium TaxID=2631580 RepID=UPI002342AD53|nr:MULTISPECIES: cation:dicarboxylase symporter family transporter [unclassified Bradyrhizobium]GLH76097.1 C4-dicarboxylate transport protein [Bradyrhizobium sp. SSBR45G]GLH83419.1 C4-dicarboxylate transport protein [Bradyrhizobium sp. SSBR45R]